MTAYIPRWFTCPQTVTHPSTKPTSRQHVRNVMFELSVFIEPQIFITRIGLDSMVALFVSMSIIVESLSLCPAILLSKNSVLTKNQAREGQTTATTSPRTTTSRRPNNELNCLLGLIYCMVYFAARRRTSCYYLIRI